MKCTSSTTFKVSVCYFCVWYSEYYDDNNTAVVKVSISDFHYWRGSKASEILIGLNKGNRIYICICNSTGRSEIQGKFHECSVEWQQNCVRRSRVLSATQPNTSKIYPGNFTTNRAIKD